MKSGLAHLPSPAKREREGTRSLAVQVIGEGEGSEAQAEPAPDSLQLSAFAARKPSPHPPVTRSRVTGTLSRKAGEGLAATVERHLRDYLAAHERGLPASDLYDRVIREIEKPLLAVALNECKGNQLRAAALLGLNRNTLRKKIRALGLKAGRLGRKNGANDE